jgi:hypothetical protein
MAAVQPPMGPVEIADPNNVPELFINGPFHVLTTGGMLQVTFTTMRPNSNDVLSGKNPPEYRATVTCRLLMPTGLAEQLARVVADTLIKAAQSSVPAAPAKAEYDEPVSTDGKNSPGSPRRHVRFE